MINVENLTKTYSGGKKAVDNVSFKVNDGEIFGFLGPNGAGKTTTIKMLTGILRKDSGNIAIDGYNIETEPIQIKKLISYVPDNPDINKKLRGIEYIDFLASVYDVNPTDKAQRLKEYADLFEMTSSIGDSISNYSHGMQQKIVLIGALISDPKIMILDEPMVGLDPKSSFNLKELMRKRAKEGKIVFFSTHVLEVAEKFCDRVAIIDNGKLIACGTLDELRSMEGTSTASLEEMFLKLTQE